MLEMRPGCECCDRDLAADGLDALICSFECTFCQDCAQGVLQGRCRNCGGVLVSRPARAPEKWAKYPPRTDRVVKPGGCTAGF